MAITRSVNKRNWSQMPHDVLVHIFTMINVVDRVTNVAIVCQSWRAAASDETLTKTLNVAEFKKHLKPRTTGKRAEYEFKLALVRGINLSGFKLTSLAFNPPFEFEVSESHLQYACQRCPNLENLVLSFPKSGMGAFLDKVLRFRPNLESFRLPSRFYNTPLSFFQIVGLNCPNLKLLKVSCCVFNDRHMETITNFKPTLKVLSVCCVVVEVDAVETFSSIENLEAVYLSVSHFRTPGSSTLPNLKQLPTAINDARKLKSFPNFKVFHVCKWEECSSSCIAATMEDAPLNIPDLPLGGEARSAPDLLES